MDGDTLKRDLAALEQKVIEGDRLIAGQRRHIDDLCVQGSDTSGARALLRACKEEQRVHLAERARLMAMVVRARHPA
jgi:hypothetical protein